MPSAEATSISDPPSRAWLRARLEELCAIERPSASPGERQAAEWLRTQLLEAGVDRAEVEREPEANGTFWWPIGLLAAASAAAGSALLRGGRHRRLLATATATAAAGLIADELPPGSRSFRRLLPKRTAYHVLAEIGPAEAERTIVVMGHHDAPHTAFFFNPAITGTVGDHAPWIFENADTSPPLMWPTLAGPVLVAAGAATDSHALTRLGTLISTGTVAFMAHIGTSDVVPAANDNGTANVAQLALARALCERPLENTRVLFLSTSEEALCEGMGLFMKRHAHELPADRTFFLCLEILGSPHLLVLRGEGMLRMREYPPESLALMDSTAECLGIDLWPNLRTMNATDAVFPLAAGYQCAALCSCNQWKNPSNYHWRTDTPENVDYASLTDAIRLSEAVIRRLDQRWLS